MVHALEKIRRLLKPGGILIDIHPTCEPATIEVRLGAQEIPAGWVQETDDYSDYEHADQAVAAAVAGGLFAIERQAVFEFVWHADSLAALRAFLEDEWEAARIDDITAGRVDELLDSPQRDKEVIMRESIRIARLRSLPD